MNDGVNSSCCIGLLSMCSAWSGAAVGALLRLERCCGGPPQVENFCYFQAPTIKNEQNMKEINTKEQNGRKRKKMEEKGRKRKEKGRNDGNTKEKTESRCRHLRAFFSLRLFPSLPSLAFLSFHFISSIVFHIFQTLHCPSDLNTFFYLFSLLSLSVPLFAIVIFLLGEFPSGCLNFLCSV